MNNAKKSHLYDAWIMFKRCLLVSMRNPEALLTAIVTPFFLMILFGSLFGSIIDIGDFNYIDYIVPGIILQSIAQASQHSAINVATDMTKGMIDRFRTMSISKYAVIIGHTGAGAVKKLISTIIIIATAFIIGFRPQANFNNWILVICLLLLINIVISLFAVLCGLASKTVEGSTGLLFPLFILRFMSSGFAPTDTMSGAIKWISSVQPMTPLIDSTRALMLNLPLGNTLLVALSWSVALIVITFIVATLVYNRKIA